MDPENAIVKLCGAGMTAEMEGKPDEALRLYEEAWETAVNATERCIAAHFLARHQDSDEATLHWNQKALQLAEAADEASVRDFYPSLYLNLAHSHEVLGHLDEAQRYYDLAAARVDELPENLYGQRVRNSIARHRQQINAITAKRADDK
jgi:tetratricopeptide (TPR) repeat protein